MTGCDEQQVIPMRSSHTAEDIAPALPSALPPQQQGATRDWQALRFALNGLFVIALFYTIYFAAQVLIPITIAVLLSILLAPAVEKLELLRLPRAIASAVIVIAALALIIMSVMQLAAPAQDWVARVPAGFSRIEERLKLIKKPIQELQKATEQIENAAEFEQRPQRR